MAKGYCDVGTVAALMGVTLDLGQTLLANMAIAAAEEWVDTNIGHAWLEPAVAITEETLITHTSLQQLKKPPVLSVDSVSVTYWPGVPSSLLPTNVGAYIVRSLRDGIVWVPWAVGAYSITTVYMPNTDPVPSGVQLATATLAAASLRMLPVFNDGADPAIVQRYVVGGELTIEFRKVIGTSGEATQQALTYMDAWVKGYSIL